MSRQGGASSAPEQLLLRARGGDGGRDLDRIDIHPTHTYQGFELRVGKPLPFGASRVPGGVNFSIYSRNATSCALVLFEKHAPQPVVEIPISDEFRIGDVWCLVVFGLDYENVEYGYRMDGPWEPEEGHRFDQTRILLDPYAKVIGGRDVWGHSPENGGVYPHRARIVFDDFDWQSVQPPRIPIEDLVIYEMHVRGFTAHPSAGVRASRYLRRHPGQDSLSQGTGGQRGGADADLRVRRAGECQSRPSDRRGSQELLGL